MPKPMNGEFGPVCEIKNGVVKKMSDREYFWACLQRQLENVFGRGSLPDEGLRAWVRWAIVFVLGLASMMAVTTWVCESTPLVKWLTDMIFVPVH
jgi:hypothetical protein